MHELFHISVTTRTQNLHRGFQDLALADLCQSLSDLSLSYHLDPNHQPFQYLEDAVCFPLWVHALAVILSGIHYFKIFMGLMPLYHVSVLMSPCTTDHPINPASLEMLSNKPAFFYCIAIMIILTHLAHFFAFVCIVCLALPDF